MRKNVTLPTEVLALIIIVVASSVTFTVAAAMTEYAFIKPYVANAVFQEPNLKTEDVTFTFDATQVIYPNVQLTVKNYGTASATATIHVYLYEGGNTIASGQGGITVDADATNTVTVGLSWSSGKNATNVESSRIVVKE